MVESIQLAQQATLETRDAKHEPRTLAEQRTTWRREAEEVLGGPDRVDGDGGHRPLPRPEERTGRRWTRRGCRPPPRRSGHAGGLALDLAGLARARRGAAPGPAADLPAEQVEAVVDLVVDQVLTARSVPGHPPPATTSPSRPRCAARTGRSVYEVAGSTLYTSAAILAAEQRLVDAAGRSDGHPASPDAVEMALLEQAANGVTLNAGQAALVTEMATSGARLQLAIAPAGAGKTTAMRALTSAWTEDGGTVLGLAPSAAAAAVLREQTGATTDTLAKLTWSPAPPRPARLGSRTSARPPWS